MCGSARHGSLTLPGGGAHLGCRRVGCGRVGVGCVGRGGGAPRLIDRESQDGAWGLCRDADAGHARARRYTAVSNAARLRRCVSARPHATTTIARHAPSPTQPGRPEVAGVDDREHRVNLYRARHLGYRRAERRGRADPHSVHACHQWHLFWSRAVTSAAAWALHESRLFSAVGRPVASERRRSLPRLHLTSTDPFHFPRRYDPGARHAA